MAARFRPAIGTGKKRICEVCDRLITHGRIICRCNTCAVFERTRCQVCCPMAPTAENYRPAPTVLDQQVAAAERRLAHYSERYFATQDLLKSLKADQLAERRQRQQVLDP